MCTQWKKLHFKCQSTYFKWMTSQCAAKDEWDPAGFQTYRSYPSFWTSCLPCASPVPPAVGDTVSSSEDQQVIHSVCVCPFPVWNDPKYKPILCFLAKKRWLYLRISCLPLSGIISDLAQLFLTVSWLFFLFEKPKCHLHIVFLNNALGKDCNF